jgi:NADH-quinone oxidoreductase subunit J
MQILYVLNTVVSNYFTPEYFCLESIWLFFCFFIILFSFFSVTSGNPVFGVFFLVLCFFNSSILLISLGANFVGLMLMVVYVGAIAVLFLFVVMMLNVNQEFNSFPVFLSLLILKFFVYIYINLTFCPSGSCFSYKDWLHIDKLSCIVCVGNVIFSELIVSFVGISVILLIALVGAISLTFSSKKGLRNQDFIFQSSRSTQVALFVKKTRYPL